MTLSAAHGMSRNQGIFVCVLWGNLSQVISCSRSAMPDSSQPAPASQPVVAAAAKPNAAAAEAPVEADEEALVRFHAVAAE